MQLKTTHSIGDVLYFMHENKIHCGKVLGVAAAQHITEGAVEGYIMQIPTNGPHNYRDEKFDEIEKQANEVFTSEKDLMHSLKGSIG